MSRTQIVMLLLLSIAFGLGAVMIAKQWLDSQTQPTVKLEEVERHPVLVAAMEIEPGVIIEEKHLKTRLMEVDWIDETTLTEPSQAVGKVASNSIYEGELVSPNRIAVLGEGVTLAAMIPEDKRALTIRVNDVIGVAGFLLPGNKVDVLNTKGNGTTTVLKNIKVLAVDQTARTKDNKPVIVRAVTLEVSPKEAEKLLTENSKGSIQLALRNPLTVDKVPPKRTYTPRPSVTVIKGSQTSNVRVSN
ncbi:Flp pilus assembly protein CpaB [Vibrio natriegens]|uniref:Flp pilus assembly protein CpaB n=1 Tax=Vibrio natriegens NBRC 15636 = ATCC 14048 = DSM 759 TaxID=1219067 RepID=A0AAN0Y3P2_VIBNA|nr:Flp pilus assembly protein CpaB [Vibrio natriegens]ALR14771.1 pilus assembly protein CpaB [Vibrio natriegens NBRC 15636 = ATCC 14048 = DSM 759]ANQ13365.1 Flp pilus assembly protein CpaB [Vibrio natriegens NBRC 15636 = ATCC 14048 = DSM 759]EPM40762.1 pilus assembly protein CpaB [Vibrio natriegens NBRC 15636 = ATCC 14048 = DSM 759]MDX6027800.1 Flp pilus assembly protein CpaB [Vibrio natriegens NBRC 15636 = ATCC 14048 = DSM 759]UUI11106.1 Flp pilus assembly protein CpaB [Vibrio natriegens]